MFPTYPATFAKYVSTNASDRLTLIRSYNNATNVRKAPPADRLNGRTTYTFNATIAVARDVAAHGMDVYYLGADLYAAVSPVNVPEGYHK